MAIIHSSVRFHSPQDEQQLIARLSSDASASDIREDWTTLLDSTSGEADIQAFLERHPSLLPGLSDLHNGPLHNIIATKLPLGPDYQTDFAFISRHSMALQFTFIEIERPDKPIFNKDGSFSQTFQQARQQVGDWALWGRNNVGALLQMFSPMFTNYNGTEDLKTVRAYLVYGRRAELEGDRKKHDRWRTLQVPRAETAVMTYDRLSPAEGADRKLIVCSYEDKAFFAKSALL